MKQPRSLRLKPDVWNALDNLAGDQNRSTSNYIETLLTSHVLEQALKYGQRRNKKRTGTHRGMAPVSKEK